MQSKESFPTTNSENLDTQLNNLEELKHLNPEQLEQLKAEAKTELAEQQELANSERQEKIDDAMQQLDTAFSTQSQNNPETPSSQPIETVTQPQPTETTKPPRKNPIEFVKSVIDNALFNIQVKRDPYAAMWRFKDKLDADKSSKLADLITKQSPKTNENYTYLQESDQMRIYKKIKEGTGDLNNVYVDGFSDLVQKEMIKYYVESGQEIPYYKLDGFLPENRRLIVDGYFDKDDIYNIAGAIKHNNLDFDEIKHITEVASNKNLYSILDLIAEADFNKNRRRSSSFLENSTENPEEKDFLEKLKKEVGQLTLEQRLSDFANYDNSKKKGLFNEAVEKREYKPLYKFYDNLYAEEKWQLDEAIQSMSSQELLNSADNLPRNIIEIWLSSRNNTLDLLLDNWNGCRQEVIETAIEGKYHYMLLNYFDKLVSDSFDYRQEVFDLAIANNDYDKIDRVFKDLTESQKEEYFETLLRRNLSRLFKNYENLDDEYKTKLITNMVTNENMTNVSNTSMVDVEYRQFRDKFKNNDELKEVVNKNQIFFQGSANFITASVIHKIINGVCLEDLRAFGITEAGDEGIKQFKAKYESFKKGLLAGQDEDYDLLGRSEIARAIFIDLTGYNSLKSSNWGERSANGIRQKAEYRKGIKVKGLDPEFIEIESDVYKIDTTVDVERRKTVESDECIYGRPAEEAYKQFREDIEIAIVMQNDPVLTFNKYRSLVRKIEAVAKDLSEQLADIDQREKNGETVHEALKKNLLLKYQEVSQLNEKVRTVRSKDDKDNFKIINSPAEASEALFLVRSVLKGDKEVEALIRQMTFSYAFNKNPGYIDALKYTTSDISVDSFRSISNFINDITNSNEFAGYFQGQNEKQQAGIFKDLVKYKTFDEVIKGIEKAKDGKSSEIQFIPSRGMLMEVSGQIANACWADKDKSIAETYPNITTIIMKDRVGTDSERIIGASMLIETTNTDTG